MCTIAQTTCERSKRESKTPPTHFSLHINTLVLVNFLSLLNSLFSFLHCFRPMGTTPFYIFSLFVILVWSVKGGRTAHGELYNISSVKGCDLFHGSWVYGTSTPGYDSGSCPFLNPQFACQTYGRPDKLYLEYKWKPNGCELPSFNGIDLLRRWRGKKIMFVGDSLSENQWQSLTCMIHASDPKAKTTFVKTDLLSSVTFEDYSVTISVYRTEYLVDLVQEKVGLVLKLDSIVGGNAWKGMDMLIFNSWHWWTHTGKRTQPWDYIQEGNILYREMNPLMAYYKGMTTWGRWVNRFINPAKTKVILQGISPTHYEGQDWNRPGKTCKGEMLPFFGARYPGGIVPTTIVVNKVLSRIKKPVYLLDITRLSQLRKDAHPSVYSGNHKGVNDCSHWCLPGLPDTWNQLLYAALLQG